MGFIDRTAQTDHQSAGLLHLGTHPKTHDPFVATELDRYSGMYVIGRQGYGKSGFLENLILADALKGHAIIVIDPHGDLTDKCLAAVPPHRLAQTFVLDMLDESYLFGINLFGLSGRPRNHAEKSHAVDRVLHVLQTLWPEVEGQQHLPLYVRTTTIALISVPGMTMLQMRRFLTDKAFRDSILAHVHDITVHEHWREHDRLSDREQLTRVQPLLNRLGAIFIGRDLVQNILGQPTTISFRKAIEHKEIVFVKLPSRQLEQDAKLVGLIVVAQVSAALFSFADLPEKERPGFSFYVDEFQNFATPDFATLFSEGRKFGVRVILAHQRRDQLILQLQHATASARIKAVFNVNVPDARELAPYFPAPADNRIAEVDAHATATLLVDPGPDPAVRHFTNTYLRPLQHQRKSGRIKLDQGGVSIASVVWVGYEQAKKEAKDRKPDEVEDPTQYLDDLLRDVMQSRNSHLTIPPKAIQGFANCGHGFSKVALRLVPCAELTAHYLFPSTLVAGDHWLREPKNDSEQFLHCVFSLRQVMRYLAAHPMGKRAEASTSAVAQLLTELPLRHALVRSGDDVGRIVTDDTPYHVEGDELKYRVAAIQGQTRIKYCHAVSQVHEVLLREPNTTPDSGPEIAGWTEVNEP